MNGCCTQLGSLSALKHAVLGLYLLVFLILVGIFILAGKSSPFLCWPSGMRGTLFSPTVWSPNAALVTIETTKEADLTGLFGSPSHFIWDGDREYMSLQDLGVVVESQLLCVASDFFCPCGTWIALGLLGPLGCDSHWVWRTAS